MKNLYCYSFIFLLNVFTNFELRVVFICNCISGKFRKCEVLHLKSPKRDSEMPLELFSGYKSKTQNVS